MHIPLALLSVLLTPLLSVAHPFKRDSVVAGPNDTKVLQFADVLEQLESTYYAELLQKFRASDFVLAGFFAEDVPGFVTADIPLQQLQIIQADEQTHADALGAAIVSLGAQRIEGCKFDFSTVLTDVSTAVAVGRLFEIVGVGAYLGAAHLISNPTILTSAASILTIEARHQTVLNILNDASAIPQAFDVALLPQEVLALAGPFVTGCDTGIQANIPLEISNDGIIEPGTTLTFSASTITGDSSHSLFCQIITGGAMKSISLPLSSCVVPSDTNGPIFVWVTKSSDPLPNDVVARGNLTSDIVAGPAIVFVDTIPEALGELARPGFDVTYTSSS